MFLAAHHVQLACFYLLLGFEVASPLSALDEDQFITLLLGILRIQFRVRR